MRRLAVISALILATVSLVYILWEFRQAIVLFAFSLAVAAATRPLVERMVSKGINRTVALLLVYLGVLAISIALFVAISNSFFRDLQRLVDMIALSYDRVWSSWNRGTGLQQSIVSQLPPPEVLYQSVLGEGGNILLQTFLGFTVSSFTFVSQFFVVLVLSIYWSVDRIYFERLWLSLLPAETRTRARDIWREIETGVGAYLRSEFVQSILVGIILGIGLSLIGLPYPTLLAVIIAIIRLIPFLGSILAVILVIIVGFSSSTEIAGYSAVFTFAILLFMELVVEPRIFHRRQFSSLLLVLVLLAMAESYGIYGVVIAPPLATAIHILLQQIAQPVPQTMPLEIGSVRQIAELDRRVDNIHHLINTSKEELPPQVINLLGRLDGLIEKAASMLEKETSRSPGKQ